MNDRMGVPRIDGQRLLDQVSALVREVARVEILPRYLKVARQHKSDGSLFTEADVAAQQALVKGLAAIADAPVLGEEMSSEEQHAHWDAGANGLWCVDPIDGTSNFVNGIAYFAVSVAYLVHHRPVIGVVYDPVGDALFCARKGGGAFVNGEPLPLSQRVPSLRRAMAGIDFKRVGPKLARELAANPPFCSQRNFGASTLDWCNIAAGRLNVYLHGGQRLWDFAAGSLILAEAGGSMCTLEKEDFWSAEVWQRSVVAALDPGLFSAWRAWVRANS